MVFVNRVKKIFARVYIFYVGYIISCRITYVLRTNNKNRLKTQTVCCIIVLRMDNVIFALNAVLPIVLLIALGYILKKVGLFTEGFLSVANKFCFRVLLPTMLFMNIYKIDSLADVNWYTALFCVGSIFTAYVIGLIIVKIFTPKNEQKGVVLQCVFRSNYAIIGIPLAEMIFGEAGKQTAALMSAFTIPVFNILAVVALTMFVGGEGERPDTGEQIKKTLVGIVKNPLIIAVALGVTAVGIRQLFVYFGWLFRLSDITFLFTAANYVSSLTTPLALIVLGGQFEFTAISKNVKQVVVATVTRTVFIPALFLTLACAVFGFKGADVATFVAIYGSPVAVASAIMAREMNADGDLAGALVVSTTVVSTFTLIIIITVLKACGIFS